MRVLVVGGAGYIGSHTVRAVLRAGHEVVILDNLSTGHEESVPVGVDFICGDILEAGDLARAFDAGPFDAVMHFAAKASVGESVERPEFYYRENVQGSLMLFSAARKAGVGGVVFSSSAATYGTPKAVPILEDAPLAPINPYGWTKRMMEQILADFARAYGLSSVSLRYFNAAGCEPEGDAPSGDLPAIGEDHAPETHLIPRILISARDGGTIKIFGTDYDTRDGTAVRDYIHVTDLAEAHVLAIGAFEKSRAKVFNLGTGTGFTVREVIDAAKRVTGIDICVEETDRRAGDPPSLVASSEKFQVATGWRPRLADLATIIETAWAWHKARPKGYAE
ncbi:MAG: UDP-glucose 4-epimerase GalE [Planctomycetota bacterium]|jgi:UDP-glucose 4-epimerase